MGYIVVAVLGRFRTYVVTDRNVYVFQASFWSKYKVTKQLEKRPLASARVEFEKGYLTLNGEHETFVGLAGPAKRQGTTLLEAARSASGAPAAASNVRPDVGYITEVARRRGGADPRCTGRGLRRLERLVLDAEHSGEPRASSSSSARPPPRR